MEDVLSLQPKDTVVAENKLQRQGNSKERIAPR